MSFVCGCSTFEHQIVQPPDLAVHIAQKEDAVIARQPVEYRFRSVDSRLVARIFNNGDEPIELLGERSSVVDPSGQSHPLRSMTIAPHSFAKLILPPPLPRIERTGPSIGIGVGGQFGSRGRSRDPFYRGSFYGDGFDDFSGPRYLTVSDESGLYWNWEGATEIRITFVFRREKQEFSQEFTIARQKM